MFWSAVLLAKRHTNLKCVLLQITEELTIAYCEYYTLADQPLSLDDINQVIKELAHCNVSDHMANRFCEQTQMLTDTQAWKDGVHFNSDNQHCCRNRAIYRIVGASCGDKQDAELQFDGV